MSAAMVGRIGDALIVLLRDFHLGAPLAGEGKRLAVLLHGFPQTWWAWRHVIPKLADAGSGGGSGLQRRRSLVTPCVRL
jgi:pimeloyl-ACP methyl ester carboxylesterase